MQNEELILAAPTTDALAKLMDESLEVSKLIPDNISVENFWHYLDTTCQEVARINILALRLRPALGRMLFLAKEHPEYYSIRGYQTYDDFLKSLETTIGLRHTKAYEAKRIYSACPSLTPAEWEEAGAENLANLVRFTNETHTDYQQHLDAAKSMTTAEFKNYIVEHGFRTRGELMPVSIMVTANQEAANIWEDFVTNPRVQSVCGTSNKAEILVHAVQECSSSWLNKQAAGLLVFKPEVRENIEMFVNDSRIQEMCGTKDPGTILNWAMAKVLELEPWTTSE